MCVCVCVCVCVFLWISVHSALVCICQHACDWWSTNSEHVYTLTFFKLCGVLSGESGPRHLLGAYFLVISCVVHSWNQQCYCIRVITSLILSVIRCLAVFYSFVLVPTTCGRLSRDLTDPSGFQHSALQLSIFLRYILYSPPPPPPPPHPLSPFSKGPQKQIPFACCPIINFLSGDV